MPGKHINQRHVEIFMGSRGEGKSVRQASAAAGFSERTGRRVDSGEWVPRSARPERWWRTRPEPLAGVWEREVEPLLREDPELRAYSLWEHALDQGWISDDRQKRTFERRVRAWKAEHGPDREVIFRQHELPPGELCCSDFFSGNRLEVTIRGAPFPHILHHFCAAWSGWQSALVVPGSGESFAALHAGLEKALRGLGGSCRRHRTDSLSAAFRNVLRETRKDVASRYQALCGQYGMEAERINPGRPQENGSIEARHGHFRDRLDQALRLRGSRDFASIAAYGSFVDREMERRNRRVAARLAEERPHLSALPQDCLDAGTEVDLRVPRTAMLHLGKK